jgi:uncharacterized protein YqgC (DUF456 family)
MVAGLIGTLLPVLPGVLISWLAVLVYAIVEGFQAIDPITFIILTLIALVTGSGNFWLPLLGAKTGGASLSSMLFGVVGAIIGFVLGSFFIVSSLVGALVGYALGIIVAEYRKQRDWNAAIKASLGGLAGWGLATALQFGGAILMLVIFVWQVLSY